MNPTDPSVLQTRTAEPWWKREDSMSLLLFCVTTAVFWPACSNHFVYWDDQNYVYNQPYVLRGINAEGLRWAATARVAENWHPLTLVSLQFDAHVFGEGPMGFHRTAVFLHAVNAVLAFRAFQLLTGSFWRSALVAAIFALHPLRVESVAWVSERKDLLSGIFFWLTIPAYVKYTNNRSLRRYLLVMFWFACGLCSKPMLVTTPFVLLLLDFWPLRRTRTSSTTTAWSWWRLIVEKIPLFALSVADALITMVYQTQALQNLVKYPYEHRFKNAVTSLVQYLSQISWPVGLSPFYAHHEITNLAFYSSLMLLVAITGLVVWQRDRRSELLVGWFWFLGMMMPVCGIIQVGLQARADRYTYLPQVGIIFLVVWSAANLVRGSRKGFVAAIGLAFGFLLACGVRTQQQIPVWRNSETLWQQAHLIDPDDPDTIEKNLNEIRAIKNRKSE